MLNISLAIKEDASDIIALENKYVSDSIKEILFSDNELIIICKENSKLVGFLYLSQVLDESEIISICVDENYRNKGIAISLWNYYTNNYDVNCCFLEVRETNFKAYNLYKKLNFKEIGIRRNYYSNNENAILMKWSR